MTRPVLVPILGDQLSHNLSSLEGLSPAETRILMMEVWDEATYVKHHKQKIVLIFSAMRHFAAELEDAGWTVDYVKLDAEGNSGSFTGEVARAIEEHSPRLVSVVEAGEWRVAPYAIFYESGGGTFAPTQEDLRHDWGRVTQNLLVWFTLLLTNGQVMKRETRGATPYGERMGADAKGGA